MTFERPLVCPSHSLAYRANGELVDLAYRGLVCLRADTLLRLLAPLFIDRAR